MLEHEYVQCVNTSQTNAAAHRLSREGVRIFQGQRPWQWCRVKEKRRILAMHGRSGTKDWHGVRPLC